MYTHTHTLKASPGMAGASPDDAAITQQAPLPSGIAPKLILARGTRLIDSGLVGYRESRRCSRDTYPESYITKYTRIPRLWAPRARALRTQQLKAVSRKPGLNRALVAPKPPQGVLVCGHAGLVMNKLSSRDSTDCRAQSF